ncbi:biotin carboxylase N-terminal domain-containing protein [Kordiimonas gwangyangensis]|uniref:ATP-binding protein n=2 Tax=Kordiimonas gwangyangensis TaxID=288022 RepID=UPI000374638C|nr:biotin carboxylase N-terminal domain-containing protein [Kordiimonas gwangyangensis]
MSVRDIKRILIANRGEIAVRVIRAAHKLGLEAVAVYSDADAHAQHVKLADDSVHIGPSPASESYLSVDKIVEAARLSGADAIHPGYGFLSENAEFAAAVEAAGIIFIGPSAEVIAKMGDKRQARWIAQDAGVPVVPGYDGEDANEDQLLVEANRIGTPLMIKATAGGGGRGLRRIDEISEFHHALMSAQREAQAAFGNCAVMLERMIESARHVEVQVLADSHGKVLHLLERDCSAQRRHQKVVEEAPCSTINASTRKALTDAAVKLATAVGYTGAGTVEFLVDEEGAVYFLEMNTRLQVEHPVTEMITGIDLVEQQIRVARGEKLAYNQEDITADGHAVEVRLYAEDAERGFLPQTGTLRKMCAESVRDVRGDFGVMEGDTVSPFYDPMLAKIIAHGSTRDEAIQTLAEALKAMRIAGLVTNKAYLSGILTSEHFTRGLTRTHTLDTVKTAPIMCAEEMSMCAGAILVAEACAKFTIPTLANWRTNHDTYQRVTLEVEGESFPLEVRANRAGGAWQVTVKYDDTEQSFSISGDVCRTSGKRYQFASAQDGDTHFIDLGPIHITATNITHRVAAGATRTGSGMLTAPMDGQVVAVAASVGDTVEAGELICVVEAMKMEHHIRADVAGKVTTVNVKIGDQVKARASVATITATETDTTPEKETENG